jgi:hypothetical protein
MRESLQSTFEKKIILFKKNMFRLFLLHWEHTILQIQRHVTARPSTISLGCSDNEYLLFFVYMLLNALPISSSVFGARKRLVRFRFFFTAKTYFLKIFTSRLIILFKITETPGIRRLILIQISFLPYRFFHNKIPYITLYFLHTQKQTKTDV